MRSASPRRAADSRRSRRTGSASTRGPSTASSAGSTVSAATIATSTAAIPPKPIERRKTCGKISSPASETATVSPETATVRPAVAIVRTIAVLGVGCAAQLLPEPADHEQAVVDRQAQPEDRDDVDREHRHVGDQREQPRSAVNAPRIATTPITSGRLAATTLPKISTSSTSRIGIDSVSARAMSSLTCSLMSRVDGRRAADLGPQPGRGQPALDPLDASVAAPRPSQRQHRVGGVPVGADQAGAAPVPYQRSRPGDRVGRQRGQRAGDRLPVGRVVDRPVRAG